MFNKAFLFLHKLYHWTLGWASHPYALYALFILALLESSVFPIPPDILLIAMTVANPFHWLRFAFLATTASVLGGVLGYGIGFLFYEVIGRAVIEFYHASELVDAIGIRYSAYAFITIFTAAFTPIPYKVITISAGFFKVPFWTLVFASIVGRGLRFFSIALLLRLFGERIKQFIDRYFNILTVVFLILFIGGFIALKFLF